LLGLAKIATNLGTVKTNVSDLMQKRVPVDLTSTWIAAIFAILAFTASHKPKKRRNQLPHFYLTLNGL